jgi:hypothetical protein
MLTTTRAIYDREWLGAVEDFAGANVLPPDVEVDYVHATTWNGCVYVSLSSQHFRPCIGSHRVWRFNQLPQNFDFMADTETDRDLDTGTFISRVQGAGWKKGNQFLNLNPDGTRHHDSMALQFLFPDIIHFLNTPRFCKDRWERCRPSRIVEVLRDDFGMTLVKYEVAA